MGEEKILNAVKEAIEKASDREFLESIELAINLKDVDLSNPKNRLNEEIILPHGRGKDVRIALFGSPEMKERSSGIIDEFIPAEEISKMKDDKIKAKKKVQEIDFFMAEAPLMAQVGKNLGVILGPRGKMPRPVPPGSDPSAIVANLKKTVKVRSKDKRTFHVPVGTRDMEPEQIAENIEAVVNRIRMKLERGLMNIHSAYVKTTMGPAIKLELR